MFARALFAFFSLDDQGGRLVSQSSLIWLMGTACQLLTIVPGGLGGLKWNLIDPLNIIKGGSRKGSEDLLIQCLLDAFTYGHKELGCSLVSELCPSWDSWESHVSSTECEHLDRSIQDVNSTVR